MLWTAIGVAGIWVAVILISVFAPTSSRARSRSTSRSRRSRRGSGVASPPSSSCGRWASSGQRDVAHHVDRPHDRDPRGLGLGRDHRDRGTDRQTGSDPTRIPIGAFFGPIAAAMLTALAEVVANVFRRESPRPKLDAEVPDRPEQPQPNDLVGVGHRNQRGGGPRRPDQLQAPEGRRYGWPRGPSRMRRSSASAACIRWRSRCSPRRPSAALVPVPG